MLQDNGRTGQLGKGSKTSVVEFLTTNLTTKPSIKEGGEGPIC